MSHAATPEQAVKMAAYFNSTRMPMDWRGWDLNIWSLCLDVDAYKVSMKRQYPPGTEYVNSYIEARGGKYANTTFFGLQAGLQMLQRRITRQEVEFAKSFWTAQGLPFPYEAWMYIVEKHGGALPVRIEAVDEGTVVPVQNVLVQIINTDPECYWLTTWVETMLLRAVWYPTTVATLSWTIKQVIQKYLEDTGCDEIDAVLPFRLHDFGSRGVSSYESAKLGGMAHLVNFMGTDTGAGVVGAMLHYGAPLDPGIEVMPGIALAPGYSIPAAEHSTITSWGRECEIDAFRNMIEQFGGPGKLVAVVSDSYNIYQATEEYWGDILKDVVENMGGTLVVRPDSGDPTVVPVEVMEILGEKYGYTTNRLGYKVLPDCVRVIQGDGINLESITTILESLKAKGWAAENIAFGMGGALLQAAQRDDQKWAMKCSAAMINGEWRDVFKSPVGDASKVSKKGRQALVLSTGLGASTWMTVRADELGGRQNQLNVVFEDGDIIKLHTFDEVRARSNIHDGIDKLPLAA